MCTICGAEKDTYTVTVNGGTADKDSYEAGDTVTITATPSVVQEFKDWTISPAVTFTSGSANTSPATFTMPASAVTVTAIFEAIQTPITVSNATEWTNVINAIKEQGAGDYTIAILNDFSIPGSTANTFGDASGINVTITGDYEISLNSNGNLFRIASGQSLTIEDTKLKGKNDNNNSVVRVSGGEFTMNGGSAVLGNNAGDVDGGGVVISGGGTFTMNDNSSVYDNRATSTYAASSFGGVYLAGTSNATHLIMNGGIIYGRTVAGNHPVTGIAFANSGQGSSLGIQGGFGTAKYGNGIDITVPTSNTVTGIPEP